MKIRGNTVGTSIKPEKVLVKSENLTEAEKAKARANIGAAAVGEAGVSSTLTVIVNDGTPDHTAEEIYAHVQGGGNVVLRLDDNYYYPLRIEPHMVWFGYIADDNYVHSVYFSFSNDIWQHEFHIPNSKTINGLIDEKLGVIENGSY